MNKLKISKYSKKCLSYIKDNIWIKIEDEIDNILINRLNDIYININENDNEKYKIIYESELKKLHSVESYPLIYIHYLDINKNNILSFKQFYNYYTENNTEISELLNIESKVLNLIKNPIKDRKILHENLYNNNFVSIDIQQITESNDLIYKEIIYDNDKIYLYEIKEKQININLVMFIIKFMKKLADSYNIKYNPLELVLLMTPQKKQKTNLKFLGPENINSGSTYINRKIFIWRYEEVYKVLIHELIHFYKFDFDIYSNINDDEYIHNCVIGEDRKNEAYTEAFALIINTFIISKKTNKKFIDLINYELNFSLYQCKKIMKFFNINNILEIISNKKCNKDIKQKTAVFSYFFIKTSFIFNLNKIMNYINNNNHDNYIDFVNESITNKKFIDILNKTNYYFGNNDFIENTFRMTCLEYY